ncbi:hypothetical protein ES703_100120 [subsurface metagenome]
MERDDLNLVEYIPCEGIPTDCTYHKLVNLAMLIPERQFDFWAKLDTSWILAGNKYWRWN